MIFYFAEADVAEKLIKIGATDNVVVAMGRLTRNCPCRVRLLGQLDSLLPLEQFEADRSHGDWFRPSEKLLAFIAKRCTKPEEGRPGLLDEDLVTLEPLLDIVQVARRLGKSVVTVRRHVREHNIPYVRIGRQLRFDLRDFG